MRNGNKEKGGLKALVAEAEDPDVSSEGRKEILFSLKNPQVRVFNLGQNAVSFHPMQSVERAALLLRARGQAASLYSTPKRLTGRSRTIVHQREQSTGHTFGPFV